MNIQVVPQRLTVIQNSLDYGDPITPQNNFSVKEVRFAVQQLLAPLQILVQENDLYVQRSRPYGVIGAGGGVLQPIAPCGLPPGSALPTDVSDGTNYIPFKQWVKDPFVLLANVVGSFEVNGKRTSPIFPFGQLLGGLANVTGYFDMQNFLINTFTMGFKDQDSNVPGMTPEDVINYFGRISVNLNTALNQTEGFLVACYTWVLQGNAPTWNTQDGAGSIAAPPPKGT